MLKKIKKTQALLILIFLLSSGLSSAVEDFETQKEYNSARQMSQGNTGVSYIKGADAVFYNPSGLARSKNNLASLQILSPQITMSAHILKALRSYKNETELINYLKDNKYKYQFASVENFSGIFFNLGGVGVLQRAQIGTHVANDPETGLPTLYTRSSLRYGGYITLAKSFLENSLLLGLNIKAVTKHESNFKLTVDDATNYLNEKKLKDLLKEYARIGTGIGGDFGATLSLGPQSRKFLHFGAMIRNIGSMVYSKHVRKKFPAPTSDPQMIDVGVSLTPMSRRSIIVLSANLKDVTNASMDILKKTHFGAEFNYNDTFGAMLGLNQGYPSYGGFINFGVIKLEAGVYSEEMGKKPGDLISTRAFARLSVGWLQ